MAKNPMGRSRSPEAPYIITEDPRAPGWQWRVLKSWQADGRKPYARAFCLVTSPMTGARGDLGDTYVSEIGPTIVEFDHDVFASSTEARRALFGR